MTRILAILLLLLAGCGSVETITHHEDDTCVRKSRDWMLGVTIHSDTEPLPDGECQEHDGDQTELEYCAELEDDWTTEEQKWCFEAVGERRGG